MRKFADMILARYKGASYELKGRVRTFFYFNIILLPILLVFIIIMNVITDRGIFQALNVLVFSIIVVIVICMVLLFQGYYNTAVTIMAFVVITGLEYNTMGTFKFGSSERFIASQFIFILPILFSTLFCKRVVIIIISMLAQIAILYNMLTLGSDLMNAEIMRISLMSMSIAIILSFIIGFLINRINDVAKRLRVEETQREIDKHQEEKESLLLSLKNVSTELDNSSREMMSNSSDFSGNIQEQASSVEEITATIEEISSGSENVNASAEEQSSDMSELMTRISELISLTMDMEENISATMNRTAEIAGRAQSGEEYIKGMNNSIEEISSTSHEMTGILSIINDISDQINLLSLNASIEAARAGEAGRGFAVVADEIAKLADQTSSSVKEIDSLIKKSDDEINKGMINVNDTVAVMREIIEGVNDTNGMIGIINDSMEKYIDWNDTVNNDVKKVKIRSDEIRSATLEQKKAAEVIVQVITGVNEISQSNARGAGEITRLSKTIASMAEDLRSKIAIFDREMLAEDM